MIKCPQWMDLSMTRKNFICSYVTEKLSPVSKWEENENGSLEPAFLEPCI